MINIYKSSSNGTLKTLEDFQQAAELLQNGFDRLQEINNGTYNPALFGPIPFNGSTCPELAASIKEIRTTLDNIRAYLKKLDTSLPVLASKIAVDSLLNIEDIFGYPIWMTSGNLEDRILEDLVQMPEEELEQLEEKYAVSPLEEERE